MDILVENLFGFGDQSKLKVPGYLIRSTAPTNIEDEVSNVVDKDQPTIQDVIERLYQNSKTGKDLGVVIAIHGYNTGLDENGWDGVLEGWYQPLCTYINHDPFIQTQADNLMFLGYRWPSESLKKKGIRKDAQTALPVLLGVLLYGGGVLSAICFVLLFVTKLLFIVPLLILGIIPFAIVLSLYLLRISLYFRDSYRATYFGVPDLVELIRQIDQGLVQRHVSDALTDDFLYERISQRIPKTQSLPKEQLLNNIRHVSDALRKESDLILDFSDRRFQLFFETLKQTLPTPFESDEVLQQFIERISLIENLANDAARRYWQDHSIELSFIGHSMGGHVTTQVIRILSDIFDPRSVGAIGAQRSEKNPSSRVGRAFRLGRLILVSPDIPVLTITSGRSNFLRSALRRFEEAYLFSSEGDLALRIASTAANYFSFPAKTRTQGYRLGNVTVSPKGQTTSKTKQNVQAYGVLNLKELPNPANNLLEYLEINVLSKNKNQKLDPASQKEEGADSVASNEKDDELIANLFTYFDCTEYRDRTDYNPQSQTIDANVMILEGQRSPLWLADYLRLFIAFATFSPRNFPKKGRDVHGGYFGGIFCKLLMYRLAFLGLQRFLDSLLTTLPEEVGIQQPIPENLASDLANAQNLARNVDPVTAHESQQLLDEATRRQIQERRKVALRYLSWLIEQKKIQSVFSPERYQVDVLGRDRGLVREGLLTQSTPQSTMPEHILP